MVSTGDLQSSINSEEQNIRKINSIKANKLDQSTNYKGKI